MAPDASSPALISLPQKIELRSGEFRLQPATCILVTAPSRKTGEYLAEQLRKSTGYALKLEVDPQVRRFERETEVMANLEHSHIVLVEGFGETNGRYWPRMER